MNQRRARLASVLRVRRAQEEMARGAVARSNRALSASLHRREVAERRLRTMPMSQAAPATVVLREMAASEMAAATLAAAETATSASRVAADDAVRAWSVAARRVEALERLSTRLHDEELAWVSRVEAATVDDIVSARSVRRSQALRSS